MTAYDETPTGGISGGSSAGFSYTVNYSLTPAGIELNAFARVAYIPIVVVFTGEAVTGFTCLTANGRRKLTMVYIQNGYVPAITVCLSQRHVAEHI